MVKTFLVGIGNFLLDIIESVVTALAIFVIIWLFFFQAHQVKGNSMYPTLENGEYLLTDKISYRLHEPRRGDIVVFHSPNGRDDYIKRITGLPGEQVQIKNKKIYIDGNLLKESYLSAEVVTSGGRSWREGATITIEEGNFFVLGDNRLHSSDSRDFGTIARNDIVGRAWLRYWPLSKFGMIKGENYELLTNSLVNFLESLFC